MQRLKNWEIEMPHAEFMAEIRRMSSGTYCNRAPTWSDFDHGRLGGHREGVGSLGGQEHSGRRAGRPRHTASNRDREPLL